MAAFELSVLLQELAAGRVPEWSLQTNKAEGSAGLPTSNSDGVDLAGALVGHVAIQVREFGPSFRTMRATFTVANTETYSITFDGTNAPTAATYLSDGTATAAEIVAGLVADINGNPTLSTYLTAQPDPTDADVLLVQGTDSRHWTVTAFSASGAGDLVITADPFAVAVLPWALPAGGSKVLGAPNPTGTWFPIVRPVVDPTAPPTVHPMYLDKLSPLIVGFGGELGVRVAPRLIAGGLARCFVQDVGTVLIAAEAAITYRRPSIYIGPGKRESASPTLT